MEKDINIDSNQCDAHLQKNLRQDFSPRAPWCPKSQPLLKWFHDDNLDVSLKSC